MKNFLRLGGLSILSVQYMYIDHKNYLADFLLAQNHVSVHFGDEFSREDSPYRIILCKVRRKDTAKEDRSCPWCLFFIIHYRKSVSNHIVVRICFQTP